MKHELVVVLLALVLSQHGCARDAQPCETTTPVAVQVVPPTTPVASTGYTDGDRVWVRFGEHWYPGRVVSEIAAGVYEVGYEGYSAEWNRVARPQQLRAYDQPPPTSSLPDSAPSLSPEAGHPVDDLSRLQPGDRVLVSWNEVWWPAVVIALEHDQARVRYDGYGAEHDELVGSDRLTTPRE